MSTPATTSGRLRSNAAWPCRKASQAEKRGGIRGIQQILGNNRPAGTSTGRSPPISVSPTTGKRSLSTTTPIRAAPSPRGCRCSTSSVASASVSGTTATKRPSLATWSGSRPSSEQAPATTAGTGISARCRRMVTSELAAISLRTAAQPPRVASRSTRVDGTVSSRALTGARSRRWPPWVRQTRAPR